MSPTVYDVRDQLRETALDERDKGDLFERLVQGILEADPYWTHRFTQVDRWANWEGRQGVRDIGIDLVAKNRDDDGWSVIQCKFYERGHRVSKQGSGAGAWADLGRPTCCKGEVQWAR